jgi:MarR family transcriptional regulator, organic hydroperoxide resistance regulator
MSISKVRRVRAGKAEREPDAGPYALPTTVSRAALLKGGSDRSFRVLVADLLTISTRMELVREHLGRRMGISGPQYSLIVAVAHLQGVNGISVGALAQTLHVSSAFIASEAGKLARRRLLLKRKNPDDRRGVLLSVAPAGRLAVDRVSTEIRAVNDLFFGALDLATFAALSDAAGALIESSANAVRYIASVKGTPQSLRIAG